MPAVPLDEQSIFNVAVKIPSVDTRAEYLSQVCGDNVALFDRLSALLQAHDERPEFLELPPPGLNATEVPSVAHNDSGTKIGPYKLLQQIGEGGFGVVYMAEQTSPIRRKVALKIIKPGMDTKEVIARFEAERQAVALMDHPNIARILDAGTTDAGRPYFVMELVKGVTITEYCDTNNLSTRERLKLFATICRAVQHAHQKGVIHRDLKPSNILVTLHDGEPVPKIIDFGVAKALSYQLTDNTMFTRYGQVIGTPQYMSPEQAEMSGLDIDTRSDIYSLGILLYELLTGRPPFDAKQLRDAGVDEMRRLIREKDPVIPSHMIRTLDADTATAVASHRASRPAALSRLVEGELDWIVMKALDKDRNRRYETSNSLAEDVDRYLLDEVVVAGPPSMTYQLWKALKRHRVASLSAATVSLSLVLGLVASLVAVGVVNAARQDATNAEVVALREKEKAEDAALAAETQRKEAERQGQQARVEAHNATQTLGLVLDILSKATINPQTGRQYTVQESLDDLASNLEHETPLPSKAAAQLHLALGKAYYFSANSDRAREHLEKSLELGEKEHGPDSQMVALSLRYLGAQEQVPEKLQRAAAIERKLNADQELVQTLTLLGVLMYRRDKLDEAQKYLEEACTLFEPSDPTVALEEIPFLPLAHVLRDRSQVKEADEKEAKAIAVAKGLVGKDFSTSTPQWNNYRAAHRYLACEYVALLFKDAKGIDATSAELASVAKIFRFLAKYDSADKCLIAAESKSRANDNPEQLGWELAVHARLLWDIHDFDGAEVLLRDALTVSQRREPVDPFMDLWLRYELGGVMAELGKTDKEQEAQANALYQSVATELKRLNDGGFFVWSSHGNNRDTVVLYLSLLRSGQDVEMNNVLSDLGISDPDPEKLSIEVAQVVALIHQRRQEYDQAIAAFESASRRRQSVGDEPVFNDWVEEELLELYVEQRELPRARRFFTELVESRASWLPRNHPNLAFTRVLLARILILEGSELDHARTLLLDARKILEKHSMTPEEPMQEISQLLAQLDQATDSNAEPCQ